jgi:hypothetical protein
MARMLNRLLLTNAAITVAAFAAVVFMSGGWQAVATAVMLMTGFGFLGVFIAIGALADNQVPPARIASRPREHVEHAVPEVPRTMPAAERDDTPEARPLGHRPVAV